ncbi:MAG: lytic murein transglycosylase [Paracoccaceae bacterium]
MTARAGGPWIVAASLFAAQAAASVDRSPFPQRRPIAAVATVAAQPVIRADAPASSLHPRSRPAARRVTRDAAFETWLAGFRRRALGEGISPAVFDRAFANLTPDMSVLRHEVSQPEFNRPIWAYLESAVSESRIRNGQEALRRYRTTLDQIEARYGVEREIVVAVWGMESAYGRLRGTDPILPSLTALAMNSRRATFYTEQLLGALRILQAGDADARHLTGSWAGAMGHTQFIPTSYLAYAVDFRGDGRRDIWSDDPTDSLASTAAYLSSHGWERGQPWGVEVRVPRNLNPRLAGTRQSVGEWRRLGLEPQTGRTLPRTGEATLLFPAGSQGPAILAFQNFRVIKRYNNADAYAIAIGHLADRMRGGGDFVGSWPRNDRPLSRTERVELQTILRRSGHYTGEVDGRIGQGTLGAVREWQAANGLPPDGYVSFALLERMRR